jgi:hypothetical protein
MLRDRGSRHIYGYDLLVLQNDIEPLAKDLGVSVTNVNGDPFGQITSAELVIEAEMKSVCSCQVPVALLDDYQSNLSSLDTLTGIHHIQGRGIERYKRINMGDIKFVDFEQLRLKAVGTQPCTSKTRTKHEQLIYTKIVRLHESAKNILRVIIAVLKPEVKVESDILEYDALLMQQDPKDYSSDTMEFEDEAWPIERLTII